MHTLFSSLPQRLFSGRLHQVPKLHISLIKLSIFTVFLIIFVTIHPTLSTFPLGENQEKSHDFRQSVDKLFPRAIRCSIQGSNPCPKWWGAVAQTTQQRPQMTNRERNGPFSFLKTQFLNYCSKLQKLPPQLPLRMCGLRYGSKPPPTVIFQRPTVPTVVSLCDEQEL